MQSNLPIHLQPISDTMTSEEKEMYSIKYTAKPIKDLSVDELPKHAKALILRIHTVTGWNVPDDTFFLNTLVSEFSKLLAESYKDLNVEEIAYAVRNYGLDIKDWGKNMNLSLIDKPISEYRRVRQCLSEAEERRKPVADIDYKPTAEELMNMRRMVVEERYQAFLHGHTSFLVQPVDGIETLSKDGFCEDDLYMEFTGKAEKKLKESEGGVTPEKTIIAAKKMALIHCFKLMQTAGYKRIYQKD